MEMIAEIFARFYLKILWLLGKDPTFTWPVM